MADIARVDQRGSAIRRIIGMREPAAVDFGAYCHLVEQARQLERVHGIGPRANLRLVVLDGSVGAALDQAAAGLPGVVLDIAVVAVAAQDRKSTRLNSSHVKISYAVF